MHKHLEENTQGMSWLLQLYDTLTRDDQNFEEICFSFDHLIYRVGQEGLFCTLYHTIHDTWLSGNPTPKTCTVLVNNWLKKGCFRNYFCCAQWHHCVARQRQQARFHKTEPFIWISRISGLYFIMNHSLSATQRALSPGQRRQNHLFWFLQWLRHHPAPSPSPSPERKTTAEWTCVC